MLATSFPHLYAEHQQLHSAQLKGMITAEQWVSRKVELFASVVNAPGFLRWISERAFQQVEGGDSIGLASDLFTLLSPMFHTTDYATIAGELRLIVTEFVILCFRMEVEQKRWEWSWVQGGATLNLDMEAANPRPSSSRLKVKVGTTPVVRSFVTDGKGGWMANRRLEMKATVWLTENI
jgi:hypothetical protein